MSLYGKVKGVSNFQASGPHIVNKVIASPCRVRFVNFYDAIDAGAFVAVILWHNKANKVTKLFVFFPEIKKHMIKANSANAIALIFYAFNRQAFLNLAVPMSAGF